MVHHCKCCNVTCTPQLVIASAYQVLQCLRRSTRVPKPVIRPGNVYEEKKPTEVLLEEICGPELPRQSGSGTKTSLEQIAKDGGNNIVKLLLSKAIMVDEFLPVTYKDVDKIKLTDPKAY